MKCCRLVPQNNQSYRDIHVQYHLSWPNCYIYNTLIYMLLKAILVCVCFLNNYNISPFLSVILLICVAPSGESVISLVFNQKHNKSCDQTFDSVLFCINYNYGVTVQGTFPNIWVYNFYQSYFRLRLVLSRWFYFPHSWCCHLLITPENNNGN